MKTSIATGRAGSFHWTNNSQHATVKRGSIEQR